MPVERQGEYTMRVCAYLRKSRDDGSGETIEETLARHRKIVDNMVSSIGESIQEYYYEVVSGESIEDRPEMTRLLYDIKAGKWDMVAVVEVSRLSRGDGSDQQMIMNAFQLTNTIPYAEYRKFDLLDADDMELFESKLQSSRRQYKAITATLNRGVISSVNEGWYISQAPYGYRNIKLGKKKHTLEIDEHAETVRMMFDMAIDGETAGSIVRKLYSMGIKSPRGHQKWSKTTVTTLISNPVYYGMIRWGYHKKVEYLRDDWGRGKKIKLDDDCIMLQGNHPAIVSQDVFDAANKNLFKGLPSHHDAPLKNPFAGLIRCGKCGHTLVTRQSHKQARYLYHATWDSSDCTCKSVQLAYVVDLFCDALIKDAEDTKFSITNEGAAKRRKDAQKIVAKMERALADAKRNRIENFDRLERHVITDEIYQLSEERNVELIAQLESSLADAKAAVPDVVTQENRLVSIETMLNAMRDESLTPEQVNRVLKQFIDHIDYFNYAPRRTSAHDIHLDIFFA